MDNHDVIATLNDLLEISRDGEQGFRTCAEGVQSPNLKALFEAAARRCAEGAAELDAKVRSLGGEPAQGGSISGSMHRAWTNIKSAITGMNEHAVLAECERGEDAAKAAYEAALQIEPAGRRKNARREAIPRRQGKSRPRPQSTQRRKPDDRADPGRPGIGHGPAVGRKQITMGRTPVNVTVKAIIGVYRWHCFWLPAGIAPNCRRRQRFGPNPTLPEPN